MTEPVLDKAVTADQPSGAPRHPGRQRWATPAAWAVFAVVAVIILGSTATMDFRDQSLAGDTSAHIMQALSLAYDSHSLNFDAADLERWKAMGWAAEPVGMFFQRYDGDRYGVAKPYGYSLFIAPFIAAFGPVDGIALGNTALLALLIGISILLMRTRYRGPVVPLTVGAFFFASYVYMYAYWAHSELFLALVVLVAFAGAVRYAQTQHAAWGLLAFAAMGFGVSEKAAFVALFAPISLLMLWKAPRMWQRVAMPLTAIGVFALAVLPYLRYSDWKSFTPYGGEHRLYVASQSPFAGSPTGWAETTFSEGSIVDGLTGPLDDKLLAGVYTVAGQHTGMLVYLPLALLLIVACVARWRGSDAWGRAAVASVLAYVFFYIVIFSTNYYGGGQSLGNRYFLQVAPAVLAMVVLVGLGRRLLLGLSLAGIVLGVVLLWPQHRDPDWAHVHIERTTALQRLLPEETNQTYLGYYRCVKTVQIDITVC